MNIGLFGGFFIPLHNGHVAVTEWMVQKGLVDELWLLVSPQNPLKPAAGLLPEAVRLRLAAEGIRGKAGIRVSDFEFRLPRPSFTWQTLAALQRERPADTLSLVIGSDNWQLFPRWARHEEIIRRHHILIYPRPGYDVDAAKLPEHVRLMQDAPVRDISSTTIRDRLRSGASIGGMVPAAIEKEVASLFSTSS